MNGSSPNNGAGGRRNGVRRLHRWLGLAVLVFVLLLATTGIALNHGDAWRLDERYVTWSWLLAVYGIEAPEPDGSFAVGGHRATLLGGHLYFDATLVARDLERLGGLVDAGPAFVVASGGDALLLTPEGELVERMSLRDELPAGIEALGSAGERVVVRSGGALFRFDAALANLEPWPDGTAADVRWSAATPVPEEELAALRELYRGHGVSVERLLLDLHSGRLFTRAGALLMDGIAVLLIVLALSGLWMWLRRR